MIYLITGVPGSGKSLRTIQMILDFQKEGRQVYADIDGLKIEGVLPSPQDWTTTPEGSVVIYDECQKIFPSTGKAGVAEDSRLRALETHRHTGHDLIFITQAPTFVHHHIRKLVGKHMHCYRALGLKGCTIFSWEGVCDNPNGFHERKAADSERWTYPQNLFQYYKSATIHTHKFKMPKKLLLLFAAAVLLIGGALFYFSRSNLAAVVSNDKTATSGAESAPVVVNTDYNNLLVQAIAKAKPVTRSLMGCAAGRSCRCWDTEGLLVDMPDLTCRLTAEGSLAIPYNLNHEYAQQKTNTSADTHLEQYSNSVTMGTNSPPSQVGSLGQGNVW
jgi:zona occludens toxin (predicted ATPase)